MRKSQTLTRDAILEADDLQKERVDVPEWGGPLWVRQMSADEIGAYSKHSGKDDATSVTLARLVVATACDESGALLFGQDDVPAVGQKNPDVIARINQAALRVNGITAEAAEKAAKNSDAAPSDSSSTA